MSRQDLSVFSFHEETTAKPPAKQRDTEGKDHENVHSARYEIRCGSHIKSLDETGEEVKYKEARPLFCVYPVFPPSLMDDCP